MEIRSDDKFIIERIKHFNSKRLENEPNLIKDIGEMINRHLGPIAFEYFMGYPEIAKGLERRADVQVVILMDYFTTLLLKYKAYTGISVLTQINALYQNTDIIKWYAIFCNEILSYLAVHDVFKVVIINDSKLAEELEDKIEEK